MTPHVDAALNGENGVVSRQTSQWVAQFFSPPILVGALGFIATFYVAIYRIDKLETAQAELRTQFVTEVRLLRDEMQSTYQRRDLTDSKIEQFELKLDRIREDIASLRREVQTVR